MALFKGSMINYNNIKRNQKVRNYKTPYKSHCRFQLELQSDTLESRAYYWSSAVLKLKGVTHICHQRYTARLIRTAYSKSKVDLESAGTWEIDVHRRSPCNLSELEIFCNEGRATI